MQDFINYLNKLGISKHSLKNYKSDVNHFASWLILKVRTHGSYVESLEQAIPFISPEVVAEYKAYLSENKIPVKTINRRLSSLRHLAKHLSQIGLLNFDFMKEIENERHQSISKDISFEPIVIEFKAYLEAQSVSHGTIKNYISDIKQFTNWLEKNPTYAQTS